MDTRIIDQQLLDTVSGAAKDSPRRRKNLNFHPDDEAPCHRLLNAMEPGSYIPPHRHLSPEKDESIIVLRGRLGVVFFDDGGKIRETALLTPEGGAMGVNIPHGDFHTVVSLESGTVFFESKAGPYRPVTPQERPPWAPGEGSAAAAPYLAELLELWSKPD
jgi:cupin fold WbuC family metalloprotein